MKTEIPFDVTATEIVKQVCEDTSCGKQRWSPAKPRSRMKTGDFRELRFYTRYATHDIYMIRTSVHRVIVDVHPTGNKVCRRSVNSTEDHEMADLLATLWDDVVAQREALSAAQHAAVTRGELVLSVLRNTNTIGCRP